VAQVRIRIRESVVNRYVSALTRKSALAAGNRVADRARANVLKDGLVNTGDLADSFKVKDLTRNRLHPKVKVYSAVDYAKFPEFGTRGSTAGPGKMLRFQPRGSGVFIFRKSVRGVRAYGFFRKAAKLSIKDFKP